MPSSALCRTKLTKRTVDALAPTDRDRVIFDAKLPGFGLKITPSGRKIFLVQYLYPPRQDGRIRRYTIRRYGEGLTPDQARGIAAQGKGMLAQGIDPATHREMLHAEAARVVQEKKRTIVTSVEAIAAASIVRHAKPHLRRWREYERMLRDYVLPEWGTRPITVIQCSGATALLDSTEEKPSAALADHVLVIIRKMFN
jgi:hypothetical protein